MRLIHLTALILLALQGCAHRSANADTSAKAEDKGTSDTTADVEQITKRARVDLDCAEPIKVEVIEEGNMWRPWTFSAKGCGKSASYLSRMGTIMRN